MTAMVRLRPWLAPSVLGLGAVVLFVAGIVTWRMMSTPPPGCPPAQYAFWADVRCGVHRLHPLRAELLWAASGILALAALGSALLHWRSLSEASPEPRPY